MLSEVFWFYGLAHSEYCVAKATVEDVEKTQVWLAQADIFPRELNAGTVQCFFAGWTIQEEHDLWVIGCL